MDSTRENDRIECISEGHLQFMREYVLYEEERSKATLDRFLTGKLRQAMESDALDDSEAETMANPIKAAVRAS
jgi:hypothetical protein